MQNPEINTEFELAFDYINQTNEHLFLTGRAGTGKTTFLKYLLQNTRKEAVVVAPTGVAAINAGGVTMHSFFQLPFGPFIPEQKLIVHPSIDVSNPLKLLRNARFNKEKIQLIKQMELLVIDEVSMVRADMIDAIDTILRKYGRHPRRPFGGIQLLLIGDLLQLPPVARDEDWNILKDYYQSPFFFDAQVFSEGKPICIELEKIYRQKDLDFITLLNKIRTNKVSAQDLAVLNEKYDQAFRPHPDESYITLSTHNHKANTINERELNKLKGKLYEFKAKVSGQFNENAFPAEETLKLKEGAQVMFIRNDKGEDRKYYNGKIATISSITDDGIFVISEGEDEPLKLNKEEWDNIRYSLDEENQKIKEDKLGTFCQYPIRLAWAITIHKSQGLTFERAIIDAGDSFSAGQVYVALSRLTNADGLVLYSRISPDSISCDHRVVSFMQEHTQKENLETGLIQSQKKYIHELLSESFDLSELMEALETHREEAANKKVPKPARVDKFGRDTFKALKEIHQVAANFLVKINEYVKAGPEYFAHLHKRVGDAKAYFSEKMENELLQPLELHLESVKSWSRSKGYYDDLLQWQLILKRKYNDIERTHMLSEAMLKSDNLKTTFEKIEEEKLKQLSEIKAISKEKEQRKKVKGETYQITYDMFKEGKDIADIATERGMALSTIESHLTRFISSGDIQIEELLETEKINNIKTVIDKINSESLSEIIGFLGDEYSYAEVRWVVSSLKKEKQE